MNSVHRITSRTAVIAAALFLPIIPAAAQTGAYGVVSPTSLNLQVLVGQTGAPQRVSLKNTGNSQLTISNISLNGNFAMPINHCSEGVKPGTHCDVYITFSPTALETETGTLTFTDNASNSPQAVSLTGTGVNNVSTKTRITASMKDVYAGAPITFTATVTSQGGIVPNGEQVAFSTSYGTLGSATLQGGVAVLTTTGVHGHPNNHETERIEAQYVGDQNFYSSDGNTAIKVLKYETNTTMTSSPNPSVYGQPITFSSSTTSEGPFGPTGRTDLFIPHLPVLLGPSYTDYFLLDVGTWGARAEYLGDDYNGPSVGGTNQVVNPTTTSIRLESSKNPSNLGKSVTIRVLMQTPWSSIHVVRGSVTLTFGSTTLGTVELADSRASITTSSLPAGEDTINVTYTPGDGNFLGSSGSFVQTVK
jgi:large repetitive protein